MLVPLLSKEVARISKERKFLVASVTTHCCVFVSLSGFLDKNNDSLNRNLKEVRKDSENVKGRASPQPLNPYLSLLIVEGRGRGGAWCRADMWLCGLVSVQVMCQSDNQILRHCFRREEVIDQKRPEMVRISVCVHAGVFVSRSVVYTLHMAWHDQHTQKYTENFPQFHVFFNLSCRLPLSSKTA